MEPETDEPDEMEISSLWGVPLPEAPTPNLDVKVDSTQSEPVIIPFPESEIGSDAGFHPRLRRFEEAA